MSRAVKIAISLPAEVLESAERERRSRGVSRSEFFRFAVESLLQRERERQAIEDYVRGYREQPESDDEIAAAQQMSVASLVYEPWDDGTSGDVATEKGAAE